MLDGGAFVLGGANSYSGVTVIQNGARLAVGGSSALGVSALELAQGTLVTSGPLSLAHAVNVLGQSNFLVGPANTAELLGGITGAGSLRFSGGGRVLLTSASTFAGAVEVTGRTSLVVGTAALSGRMDQCSNLIVSGGASLSGSGTVCGVSRAIKWPLGTR